jgi:hypothetical protein
MTNGKASSAVRISLAFIAHFRVRFGIRFGPWLQFDLKD